MANVASMRSVSPYEKRNVAFHKWSTALASVPLGRGAGKTNTTGLAAYVVAHPNPTRPGAVVAVPATTLKYAGPGWGQYVSGSMHVESPASQAARAARGDDPRA
jgi:hypothetical protein